MFFQTLSAIYCLGNSFLLIFDAPILTRDYGKQISWQLFSGSKYPLFEFAFRNICILSIYQLSWYVLLEFISQSIKVILTFFSRIFIRYNCPFFGSYSSKSEYGLQVGLVHTREESIAEIRFALTVEILFPISICKTM